jgi:acrylyl-CoA reductase (NADPH)
MCAGMLDAALDHAVRYASRRTAFGRPVIEFQGLQWSLVDADTDLAALRLLAYRAAQQIDAGDDADVSAAQAKKLAGSRVLGHLAACVQAMGANGLRADHPLMRHLNACKIAAFTDGTTEMMNERLGKLLVRRRAGNGAGD